MYQYTASLLSSRVHNNAKFNKVKFYYMGNFYAFNATKKTIDQVMPMTLTVLDMHNNVILKTKFELILPCIKT